MHRLSRLSRPSLIMAQTPNVIALAVMQRLKETGDPMLMHFTSLIKSVMRKSDALLRRADEALYMAKDDGRNNIRVAV